MKGLSKGKVLGKQAGMHKFVSILRRLSLEKERLQHIREEILTTHKKIEKKRRELLQNEIKQEETIKKVNRLLSWVEIEYDDIKKKRKELNDEKERVEGLRDYAIDIIDREREIKGREEALKKREEELKKREKKANETETYLLSEEKRVNSRLIKKRRELETINKTLKNKPHKKRMAVERENKKYPLPEMEKLAGVLRKLDDMLEHLPEDKIREFARSKEFHEYKEIMRKFT